MSGGSIVSQGGDNSFWNKPFGNIGGGENSFFNKPFGDHSMPDAPAPVAPPDPNAIRQDELKKNLSDEQRQNAARTLFTGGTGLLDQPHTASRVLLGS